jgi:hypothetical protein
MATSVRFAEIPVSGTHLDFDRLPKLVIADVLHFEHKGTFYEETLRPRLYGTSHLEIRAIDGTSMFREKCLESFVNTVFWLGLQWPPQACAAVLLNAPNTTRAAEGKRVGGRYCDVWWFADDRTTLYSVVPEAQHLQSRWPPRDDSVYTRSPVGVARRSFPLIPPGVCEVLPRSLLQELLVLRSSARITEREHHLLKYVCVPPEPPERSTRAVFMHDDETVAVRCWDLEEEEMMASDGEYEESWDVEEVYEDEIGLWKWVHCLGMSKPILMRERYREESPCYLDFTEPIVSLVRMRDMGLDPKAEPGILLIQCLEVVLDCCPPLWREEALNGVIICPTLRKILVTAKSCHYLMRAVPLSLRMILGLTHSSGFDFPCKWGVNMPSGPGRRVTWRISEDETQVAGPRKYVVKNNRFTRSVRDVLNLGDVQRLTWADLKMYEMTGGARADVVTKEDSPKKTIERTPELAKTTGTLALEAPTESPMEAVGRQDSVSEAIRLANELARLEKERRKQATVACLQTQTRKFTKRRGRAEDRTESVPDDLPSKTIEKNEERKVPPCLKRCAPSPFTCKIKETDEDLDVLLRESEDRRCASETFRSVSKHMKKALEREKRLEARKRLSELFGA